MNKKVISQLSVALVLMGLVACSSSSETTDIKPVVLERDPNLCYFENAQIRAPNWICGVPIEGYSITAVGSFQDTRARISFARNQAIMDARVKLATEMKAKVGAMIKNHAEIRDFNERETLNAVASVTQQKITVGMFYGAKAINYQKGPDGTTYALVAMDSQQAASAAEQAIANSYKSKQAQWQRFLGEKDQRELEAEMNKMIDAEFGTTPQ